MTPYNLLRTDLPYDIERMRCDCDQYVQDTSKHPQKARTLPVDMTGISVGKRDQSATSYTHIARADCIAM